jgi:shikimate kinase
LSPALNNAIVLIGMPGAGKTTVGFAVAQLLQWRFLDVDDMVAGMVGDVPDFIEANGIEAFRDLEADAIRSLQGADGVVISVGGGAVLNPLNRALLDELGVVVWLRATLPTLLDHVGDGTGRPLLAGGAEAALTRLLEERASIYDDTADVVVDVDGLDPYELAGAVVHAVCE